MVNVQQRLNAVIDPSSPFLKNREHDNTEKTSAQGLPTQDVSKVMSTAQKQTYKPTKTLARKARLTLIRTLNRLSQPDFEELVFALDPPKGIIPSSISAPGDRTKALLDWAEGPTGVGLPEVLDLLNELGLTIPLHESD